MSRRNAVVLFSNLRLVGGVALVLAAFFAPAWVALLLAGVVLAWNVAAYMLGDLVRDVGYDDEARIQELEPLILGFVVFGTLGVAPLNGLHYALFGLILLIGLVRHVDKRPDPFKYEWLDAPVEWGLTYGVGAVALVASLIYILPVLPFGWSAVAFLVALVNGYFVARRTDNLLR